jgi:hypothetical protein
MPVIRYVKTDSMGQFITHIEASDKLFEEKVKKLVESLQHDDDEVRKVLRKEGWTDFNGRDNGDCYEVIFTKD